MVLAKKFVKWINLAVMAVKFGWFLYNESPTIYKMAPGKHGIRVIVEYNIFSISNVKVCGLHIQCVE